MEITTVSGSARINTVGKSPQGESRDYPGTAVSYKALLRKPDKPIINPKAQDGFRKPSSYYARHRGGTLGRLQDNTYTAVVNVSGGGVASRTLTGWEYSISGNDVVQFGVGAMPNHADKVRMRILNNVKNEVLDVAMVLAEIGDTAQTLSNNLLRVGRSMEQLSRRKPANFSYLLKGRLKDNRRPTDKFLRETADLFLEWKYGIMPTVYDIQNAAKALDMHEDGSLWDNPPLLVGRATESSTRSFRHKLADSIPGNPGGVNSGSPRQEVVIEGEIKTEHKARLDYSVSGQTLRGLNRFGLGLGSVATVAFDKTPFTFVLNMAVPIAELIKAWTALAGVEVRGYCETQYRQVSITGGVNVVNKNGIQIVSAAQPFTFAPEFVRTAFAQPPMPKVHVRNPIKLSNIQTVLALFTQLRKPTEVDAQYARQRSRSRR